MPYYLSQKGLDTLLKYKSHGEDRSLTLKYVLRPMYHVLIEYVPLWLAPNLMTMFGFCAYMIPFFVLLQYCGLEELCHAPRWVYLMLGIGLFVYQTADNMDGRQARRTGTSSPLGEFFDHGVDSLIISTAGIGVTHACLLIGTDQFMTLVLPTWMPFYLGTWEAYHSGSGLLLREINGPIEGVLLTVSLALISGIAGPEFWAAPAPAALQALFPAMLLPASANGVLQNRFALLWACIPPAALTMVMNVARVLSACSERRQSVLAALSRLLPFCTVILCAGWWQYLSPVAVAAHVYQYHTIVTLGFAYIVGRLIVGHLCKEDVSPVFPPTLVVPAGVLNLLLGEVVPDETMLLLAFVVITATYVYFIVGSVADFCTLPGVYLFRIPHRKTAAK